MVSVAKVQQSAGITKFCIVKIALRLDGFFVLYNYSNKYFSTLIAVYLINISK